MAKKLSYREEFGQNLKKIRQEKKLTIFDLCSKAQIEPSTLNRIENGKANTTIETIHKIALGLGLPVKELFNF